jgi:hypothetical protein
MYPCSLKPNVQIKLKYNKIGTNETPVCLNHKVESLFASVTRQSQATEIIIPGFLSTTHPPRKVITNTVFFG